MNELQIFSYESNEVRTIMRNGAPWFCLMDVCRVLDLSSPHKVAERLDPDDLTGIKIRSGGQYREMTFVNESGLYTVILRSDKPEAKPFRKWVTSEVLPTIRKHGAYMTPDTIEKVLTDPDTIIRLATILKEEQEKRRALEAQVEADRPKVLFADSVSASKDSILVRELATLLKQNGVSIGQNRLFAWIRENGYLIRRRGSDRNMPTQKSMELGLFEIKETVISRSDGTPDTKKIPKITGKGQRYFIERFLGDGEGHEAS